MQIGVLLRAGSAWIGAHWSPDNRRLCVNLIPFVTIWFGRPPAPRYRFVHCNCGKHQGHWPSCPAYKD